MDYKPKAAEVQEWVSHPVTKVFAKAIQIEIMRLSEERATASYAFHKTDAEVVAGLRKNVHEYNKLLEVSRLSKFIAQNGLMEDDHEAEV
jgi:hypothetical protein